MTATRKKIVSGVFVFLAVILVAAALSKREPRHAGRPISAWMVDLRSEKPETHQAALEAIRALGPAAVPYLTNAFGQRNSIAVQIKRSGVIPQKVVRWVGRAIKWNSPITESKHAAFALQTLGTNALTALPHLVDALGDPALAYQSAQAISAMGSNAIPALRAELERGASVEWTLMTIGMMGTNGAMAAPDVVPFLSSSNRVIGDRAYTTMVYLGPASAIALTNALVGTNTRLRIRAANVIQQLGARAPLARPYLVAMARDPDPAVRRAALIAYSSSAPSREESAPVWLDGLNDSHVPNALFSLQILAAFPGNVQRYSNEIAQLTLRSEPALSNLASNALSQFRSWPPSVQK